MSGKARTRGEIEARYKWKLEDIYSHEEDWEKDFSELKNQVQELEKHMGTLGESAEKLLSALTLLEKVNRMIEALFVYAKMRKDEDNTNSHYQTLFDRAQGIMVQVGSATSYVVPEIIAIPEEKLQEFMAQNQDLELYRKFFDELLRQKEHILSSAEEKILAMSADLSIAPKNIFSMFNNADIKFPVIKDENGDEVELTKGRYGRLMESSDRRVRKEAFEGLYGSYTRMRNTLASTLSSSVKTDIFYSRARKYGSALQASLDQDNISPEVYDNLIKSVHNNLDHMYRYMKLRKKMLELDELHMYDIYTPLVKEFKLEVDYEEAKNKVLQGLAPLGSDYLSELKKGLESGWIDVYENEGKTSGAYSWGSYDSHPYVLLNYDNKLDDVFTLAHEMGHSMHTYYSNKAQPYIYSQYTIFVAEVASTVNESLLIDYLLKNSTDPREKMFLINHYLEQFRGTVYRQTMFAEFEKIVHEQVEAGQALTPEALSQIYRDLNALYYGPEVVLDKEIDMEWARIPHFYSAFYVYKYATGFSAATAIKEMIMEEGQPAVDRYLEFLSSGSYDYPVSLLQKAGVDLTTPQPVDKALQYFGSLVSELEAMI
ncbi:oligoendopeptidase f [hydrocarbon metagenome]|uniref:Oligoendopeptidase f n=1 Tax=hydrocarbon metagenome TaxID=938273 RepID=A0A0W8E3N6_9ZZZZ